MFLTYFNTLLNKNPTKYQPPRWDFNEIPDFESNQSLQTKHGIGMEFNIRPNPIP